MAFNNFIGQRNIVKQLNKSILSNSVLHSYVFSGPKGIGKKTLADAFASELICTDPNEQGKCGKCNSCKMYKANIPSDHIWLKPEKQHVTIDDIRKIQNDIVKKPLYSDRKIYVIQNGGDMTVQAQNCLLKILEEPPDYTVIIILADSSESLIPTVRSRVRNYELNKYKKDDLYRILSDKGIEINEEYMNTIYGYSGGNPGKAIQLIDSEEFSNDRDDMLRLILDINSANISIVDTVNYFDENKENIQSLLNILQLYYRDILVLSNLNNDLLINTDKKDTILKISDKIPLRKAVGNIQCIYETSQNIRRNSNFRLAVENMIMKLMED